MPQLANPQLANPQLACHGDVQREHQESQRSRLRTLGSELLRGSFRSFSWVDVGAFSKNELLSEPLKTRAHEDNPNHNSCSRLLNSLHWVDHLSTGF